MIRILALAALIGTASSAQARVKPVPVPILFEEAASYPACSTASIMNLPEKDPFLSVRAGPSTRHAELARLKNGDAVFACARQGNWFGIVFAAPDQNTDCGVDHPPAGADTYTGPCRSGWVHHRFIGGYADWISP